MMLTKIKNLTPTTKKRETFQSALSVSGFSVEQL